MRSEECVGRTIGVVTCKVLRGQAHVKLWQDVQAFLDLVLLPKVEKSKDVHLAVTGGTYASLQATLKRHPTIGSRVHGLAPSASGVIQLANLAVYGQLVAVAFFNHMDDMYADSPQNLCLRRICNHFDIPLLEDFATIKYVLESWPWNAKPRTRPAGSPHLEDYYGAKSAEDVVKAVGIDPAGARERRDETLAVIAHNGRKLAMLTFCLRNVDKILEYRRIITTGTTGKFLKQGLGAMLDDRRRWRNKCASWGWDPTESAEAFLRRKVRQFESGPAGGDVQISAKIIDGTCHRVLFFQDPDPEFSHPHQFDIRLLEKAAQDPETAVLFATSEATAERIV